MEKKLRVQLFDEEGRLSDDRTVSQDPEFSKGPPKTHSGLFRIEFTLDNQDDIDKAKKYLDQLIGALPVITKERKNASMEIPEPEQREGLLETAIKESKDQDELISFLRSKGFKFMMTDFLLTFEYEGLVIKDRHLEEYQWMLLQTKKAKNPKSEKYDPMLVFGIKLIPEHAEKIVVYLNGEYHKSYKVPIPAKPKEVFKKTAMVKFPHYMTLEEREKFRYELSQYKNQPDRKLSKFFKRWRPYVENLPNLPQDKSEAHDE